jgi:hypothetical protein
MSTCVCAVFRGHEFSADPACSMFSYTCFKKSVEDRDWGPTKGKGGAWEGELQRST